MYLSYLSTIYLSISIKHNNDRAEVVRELLQTKKGLIPDDVVEEALAIVDRPTGTNSFSSLSVDEGLLWLIYLSFSSIFLSLREIPNGLRRRSLNSFHIHPNSRDLSTLLCILLYIEGFKQE